MGYSYASASMAKRPIFSLSALVRMSAKSYFLAFARLAPVQLTWFGHPDTTGIPNLDYFVSSALFELGDAQSHNTEHLVTLPETGNIAYYHRPATPAEPAGRAHFGS